MQHVLGDQATTYFQRKAVEFMMSICAGPTYDCISWLNIDAALWGYLQACTVCFALLAYCATILHLSRVSGFGDSYECKFTSIAPTNAAILPQVSQVCVINHADFPLNLYEQNQRTGNCGQKSKDDLIGEKVCTDLGATSEPHVPRYSRRGRLAFYFGTGSTGELIIGDVDSVHYAGEIRYLPVLNMVPS